MELHYSLNQNDFLQHQLYLASKSERVKKKRRKSWVIACLGCLSLCYLFYATDNDFMMYSFLGFTVFMALFYPLYLRRHYYTHYQKHIAEAYKNSANEPNHIYFTENSIEVKDSNGELKINLASLSNIIETGQYFYVGMKTGGELVIPKINIDSNQVRTFLESLAHKQGISYTKDLDWKWR